MMPLLGTLEQPVGCTGSRSDVDFGATGYIGVIFYVDRICWWLALNKSTDLRAVHERASEGKVCILTY